MQWEGLFRLSFIPKLSEPLNRNCQVTTSVLEWLCTEIGSGASERSNLDKTPFWINLFYTQFTLFKSPGEKRPLYIYQCNLKQSSNEFLCHVRIFICNLYVTYLVNCKTIIFLKKYWDDVRFDWPWSPCNPSHGPHII
jgi:hypothetical protein